MLLQHKHCQAPLHFLILFLPYLPAHSHPVIAMVMWSCLPSVSGRNSNSSMAPTRFFILYPTHKAETQISEIAQEQTLLTTEIHKRWLGSWLRFSLSKTLSRSMYYLVWSQHDPSELSWSVGISAKSCFAENPASGVTATALCCCTFLIQSRKLSSLLLSHVSNTIFLVSHQACLEIKAISKLWDHTSNHFPCSAGLGHALHFGTRSCASVLVKCAVTLLPVRPAPAAPKRDAMTAIPAVEPRAAAPALPMIVAAPAATRGAARPPVKPEKATSEFNSLFTKCKKQSFPCAGWVLLMLLKKWPVLHPW